MITIHILQKECKKMHLKGIKIFSRKIKKKCQYGRLKYNNFLQYEKQSWMSIEKSTINF